MSAEGPEEQADVNEMVDLLPVWRGPNAPPLQPGRQLPDQPRAIPARFADPCMDASVVG
jgi:hypothetical protein